MGCTRPLMAYRSRVRGKSGKLGVTFERSESAGISLEVPCGQCMGCRVEKSRQWAVRMMHESSLHEENCFLTMTYSDEHLPKDGSLSKRDTQLFYKRLRERTGKRIRYYQCGEYGPTTGRPHYHSAVFGYRPNDLEVVKNEKGYRIYNSEEVNVVWGLGLCVVGELTFDSAQYVAGYVTKKLTGVRSSEYESVDELTGEVRRVQAPFATMSRRPGIGAEWLEKYGKEVYPDDFVIQNGRKVKPPMFYDKQLELSDPALFEAVKRMRERQREARPEESTSGRLYARDRCNAARAREKRRSDV